MSSYVDILLVILLWDWSAKEFSSSEEEDLLGADQEDEEENPEEQVDQVQEQPDVESLLVSEWGTRGQRFRAFCWHQLTSTIKIKREVRQERL